MAQQLVSLKDLKPGDTFSHIGIGDRTHIIEDGIYRDQFGTPKDTKDYSYRFVRELFPMPDSLFTRSGDLELAYAEQKVLVDPS